MGVTISLVELEPVPEGTEDAEQAYVPDWWVMHRSLLPEECIWHVDGECLGTLFDGAYSRYNRFREWLAWVVFDRDIEELWEEWDMLKGPYPHSICYLLNYADNEGYIGPTAVKAIAGVIDEVIEKARVARPELASNSEMFRHLEAFKYLKRDNYNNVYIIIS